ncbi:hypothetical protein A3Q56_06926, partial [Intoshia linei]
MSENLQTGNIIQSNDDDTDKDMDITIQNNGELHNFYKRLQIIDKEQFLYILQFCGFNPINIVDKISLIAFKQLFKILINFLNEIRDK